MNLHGLTLLFPLIEIVVSSQLLHDALCVPVVGAAIIYLFMNWGVSRTVSVV